MSALRMLPFAFDVEPLVDELKRAPELWNEFDLRTNHPESPHRELDDIFVRYNARENFKGDRGEFNEAHDAVWWKSVIKLPTAQRLAFEVMEAVDGERLGMVLITRIPAGATCHPHVDNGWHARHFDKFALQLTSAPGQAFHVEQLTLSAEPGECYFFDNSRPHWVINKSSEDRMTMIVCIRNRFTEKRV